MGGNNPFMPGANPGGPVLQPNPGAVGGASRQNSGLGRGPGASILAPGPPGMPPSGRAGPPPASKAGQPFADVHQQLKYTQSQFKQGQQAQQVLDHLRRELDGLMEMGDTVRPEHVIEAAGRLVGHGIGATQVATIMSDMPAQGGEGLASWIRMHEAVVTNAEAQLIKENLLIQHQMAVAGLRSMAATHLVHEATQGPQATQGPTPMNQLAPGSNMAGPSGVEGGVDQGPPGGMGA